MATESIGDLIPTAIPGYADAADIQAALRAYHYGSYSYNPANTSPASLISPSIAKTIYDIQQDIVDLENRPSSGGDVANTAPQPGDFTPSGIPNGYIWVDQDGTIGGQPISATAVFTATAPTSNLSTGVIWVDQDPASITDNPFIATAIIDAKGDLIAGGGNDSAVRLAVASTNGWVLNVNSATSSGLAWVDSATSTQTFSNKSISLGSNTLTGTTAQFNTALTDGDFATLTGTETLSGKTISATNNTLSNIGNSSLTNSSVTVNGTAISLGASGTITVPVSTGITGLGTGIATALAVNVGTAGAPVVNGGALGTPSSGTLTNATGLPVTSGISGLASGVATFLATPSSANLISAVTDETGTGALVFGTSPTITTPTVNSPVLVSPEERVNVVAAAATGTVALDALTAGTWLYTSNATGNWTLNVRGSASTSLNSILATGDSITVVFLNTNGASAFFQNGFQVDGTTTTIRWQGGTAPSSGNASSIDAYVFTIIKTAATPTYTVLGSQTRFA